MPTSEAISSSSTLRRTGSRPRASSPSSASSARGMTGVGCSALPRHRERRAMNVGLAIIAGIAVAGAVLAVSSRDVRATVLGVLVLLLASPLVATPLPSPAAILARVAAGLLAARFLTIGLRGETLTAGTRIGWAAEGLAAAAAAVVGFGTHGLGA